MCPSGVSFWWHSPFLVFHSVIFFFAFAHEWFWRKSDLPFSTPQDSLPFQGIVKPLVDWVAPFCFAFLILLFFLKEKCYISDFLDGKREVPLLAGKVKSWTTYMKFKYIPFNFHLSISMGFCSIFSLCHYKDSQFPLFFVLYQWRFLSPTTTVRRNIYTVQKRF